MKGCDPVNLWIDDLNPAAQSSNSKDDIFKCFLCNFERNKVKYVQLHLVSHHYSKQFFKIYDQKSTKCVHCQMEFSTNNSLKTHLVLDHDAWKRFVPEERHHLKKNGLSSQSKVDHKQSTDEQYHCHMCRNVYSSYQHILVHYADSHFREKLCSSSVKNVCQHCQSSFSNKKSLSIHLAVVHNALNDRIPSKEMLKRKPVSKNKEKQKRQPQSFSIRNDQVIIQLTQKRKSEVESGKKRKSSSTFNEERLFTCIGCKAELPYLDIFIEHLQLCKLFKRLLLDRYEKAKNQCRICDRQLSIRKQLLDHLGNVHQILDEFITEN